MWSLARRLAIFTQNSSEYPKTSRQSLVAYGHSGLPLGFWIFTLVFREYFANRLAKLHILPHYWISDAFDNGLALQR